MWEAWSGAKVAAFNEARREEERLAMKLLGLQPVWLDFQDAPFRHGIGGKALYNSNDDLFGRVAPEERQNLVPQIAEGIRRIAEEVAPSGRVRVFAPLGVGNHVDHQLVRLAARSLGPRYGVLYYEDYPYATTEGALKARLERQFKAQGLEFNNAGRWARVAEITELIGVKIAAISKYKSQLRGLFEPVETMPAAVRAYAEMVAGEKGRYAERFWQLPAVWTLSSRSP